MTEPNPPGQSKVIQAVTATASDNRTFYIGVGLMGVWVAFMAYGLFTGQELPLWAHAPGVLGATLAAPGSLARVASAWKTVK